MTFLPSRGRTSRRLANGPLPWTLAAAFLLLFPASASAADSICVILNGLGGLPEYEENFVKWSDDLARAFEELRAAKVYRLDGRSQRKDEILRVFREAAQAAGSSQELWIFLVGHANADRDQYKFNIRGPDLTDGDLRAFLDEAGPSRTYLVAATGSSGVLGGTLPGDNRVIVTATRTASERFPPLFMSFFVESATSAEADTDKDGKVSLLEAYLFARRKVADWFGEKGRIQTEHALLFDQASIQLGDKEEDPEKALGVGMLSSLAFLSAPPEKAYRNLEAQALAQEKRSVEREVEALKFQKAQMNEAEYYQKLEELLVKLSQISLKIEELEKGGLN